MKDVILLGIESSCDDTSAAVIRNNNILANIVSNQKVHEAYGGVVPELASRSHQKNILPVVYEALKAAGVTTANLNAIAVTSGPGLLGSLLVGSSFAKSLSASLAIPLIEVNHMQAHILAHFIEDDGMNPPKFPFLNLTISGGHTQLVLVKDYLDMEVVGTTIDDAAGEAFDKVAKMLGLEYPGGPLVDKMAKKGDPTVFSFPHPSVDPLKFSFSGLKTSVLYFLKDMISKNPDFVNENLADICASVQNTIVTILLDKLEKAAKKYGISEVAVAGGVSANSELRRRFEELGEKKGWTTHIPKFEYCTDNAAMVCMAGYYKYLGKDFGDMRSVPTPNLSF